MPMISDDLATQIVDAMKSAGYFDVLDADGNLNFDQNSYDYALAAKKVEYGVMVAYLQGNMDVVGVSTTVAPGIALSGTFVPPSTAVTGATVAPGVGTQTGTGKVL